MPALPPILNLHEAVTNKRLAALTERYGAHTFVKLRLKDVLPLDGSGVNSDLYAFSLRSHFDFVVTGEDHRALFAVEFDGQSHRSATQQARDARKDALCKHFSFPLLRINSNYLREVKRGMDLLAWCVHVWFIQQQLNEAQERGDLPQDEAFVATDILYDGALGGDWPLFLLRQARVELRELARRHKRLDAMPSCFSCWDEQENLRVMAWLRVGDGLGLYTTSGMRRQCFPAPLSEGIEDIAVLALVDMVKQYLGGRRAALPMAQVDRAIRRYQVGTQLGHASLYTPAALTRLPPANL